MYSGCHVARAHTQHIVLARDIDVCATSATGTPPGIDTVRNEKSAEWSHNSSVLLVHIYVARRREYKGCRIST